MATLADLRLQVRRDLHDLAKPQEQQVDADPALVVYPIPTLGPILTGTMSLDIDGVAQASNTYTLYESGFVQFSTPPSGAVIHAVFKYGRFSEEDLTQYIQEAVREFSLVQPKQNKRRRTPVNVNSAHLTSDYAVGDGQFIVDSTSGYDPRGILRVGNTYYLYTSIDATHFLGLSIWVGPDAAQVTGSICRLNDNENHGWVLDPNVVRFVYVLMGYEPNDEFGIASGYQEIAYFNYDEVTGYVHIEFDFSQLETGNVGSAVAPLDQFQLSTGEYYTNPVADADVLDVPDYALNPISWLAAALAAESRESDRDFDYKEQTGLDTTANPTLTFQKVGAANRKKWEDWVKTQFRPFPRSRRRMYQL